MSGSEAGTAFATGRLVGHCAHGSGWTHTAGESRCNACGTRRFTQYGALRPPGLPRAIGATARDPHAADRTAARNLARFARRRQRQARS
ncbi:DUF6255 family natural product biosynthesis protein [Streptomyces cinnamoneus]|uniref:Uncharacterized protein n=1 Tax=Streptomyces cinnamoneus TaxID=53446 RepID=A0A918WM43_STRCJ|nr:hypothetical protein GCM10010507_39880 [Streptomyces cinnamoneus]